MAERKKGNLATTRTKVSIVANAESFRLLFDGCPNGTFDLAFGPGFDNNHVQSEALHGGVRQLDIILHEAGIIRINKESNAPDAGEDLMQQFHPLGDQFDSHKSGPGDVSSRMTEAGSETGADWIGSSRKHYRNGLCCRHRGPDGDIACACTDDGN